MNNNTDFSYDRIEKTLLEYDIADLTERQIMKIYIAMLIKCFVCEIKKEPCKMDMCCEDCIKFGFIKGATDDE